jgi:FkbM family methyltransferase
MFRHKSGWWFPDHEAHFTGYSKKGKPVWEGYQRDRLDLAFRHVQDWSCAVDGGAHVGLITRTLAKRFKHVHAFEPCPETFECLRKNTAGMKNVVLHNAALGAAKGTAGMENHWTDNSGDRQLVEGGRGVTVVPLDDVDLDGLGLLKLDVQGYEYYALKGAERTLCAFSPVVIAEVEPKGKLRTHFVKEEMPAKFLESLEAQEVYRVGADRVYTFGPSGARPYAKYRDRGAYHWVDYENGKTTHIVDETVAYIKAQGHASLVDLGCGDGLYTHKLGAFGVDNNVHAVDLARQRGVDCAHLSVYRARELKRRFDAACMFDVFEHLYKQDLALRVAADLAPVLYLLNPAPNGSEWHTREFEDDALVAYAAKRRWRLVHRIRFLKRDDVRKTLLHLEKVR